MPDFAALRRDAGEVSSPLVPVLGLSVACAAALITASTAGGANVPADARARIYTTVQPKLVAPAAIAVPLLPRSSPLKICGLWRLPSCGWRV